MCQYLPTGEFKFHPIWNLEEILRTEADAECGFFVEVDLHCPSAIHEKLNDYPPAPSKTHPSNLSPFQRKMIQQNVRAQHPDWSDEQVEENIEKAKTTEKLIASLEDKQNYVCHYRLLQKYVELGLQVIFLNYSTRCSGDRHISLISHYHITSISLSSDNEGPPSCPVSTKALDEGIYRI